ncbi:ABC transporter substrate-binding protein [Paenibacillus arenosi]|nr:iron-siderophore ABC transporter substrate-binding protein [Paenibacillus arenosi]
MSSNQSKRSTFKLRLLPIMLACVIALIAAGCGAKDSGTTTPAAPKTSTEAPAATETPKTDEVRKVKHSMGEAEIKGTPKNVVVLTNEATEAVLALGVKPVGAVKSGLGDTWFPHLKDQLQGVTELGEESEPNLELIASLKPDLIIANKVRHEKIYSQLQGMAPTVVSEDLAGDWKQNFTLYAEALNLKDKGAEEMKKYDDKVAEAKTKIGDKLSTKVSMVRFVPEKVRIYMNDTFSGVILKDLGFARPAAQDKDEFMEVVTKERMADMDGDIMFYFNADFTEEKLGTKQQEEWMKDPLFQQLEVAKNKKTFKVDEVIWNLSGNIISANLLVDELVKYSEQM